MNNLILCLGAGGGRLKRLVAFHYNNLYKLLSLSKKMLNISQIIIDDKFTLGVSINNREDFIKEQKNPIISFHGFQEIKESTLKEGLIKIISENIYLIAENSYCVIKNVTDLNQNIEENIKELKDLKFKNYHKFWKKYAWNQNFEKIGGSNGDALSLICSGMFSSIPYFLDANPHLNPPLIFAGIFTIFEIANESHRRTRRKDAKKVLKYLEGVKNNVNNFIENVKKSKVCINYNIEVKNYINELKNLKDAKIDISKTTEQMINMYKQIP